MKKRARLKKLTYWVAECLNDHAAYNLRAQTRREITQMFVSGDRFAPDPSCYGKPHKVTVEYRGVFDLLCYALGEGGISERETL